MVNLRGFRKVNDLTQEQLANYLGIRKGFVSRIENGFEKLPKPRLESLLNNSEGWDTSMLTEIPENTPQVPHNTQTENSAEVEVLKERIKGLESLLEEKERLIKILLEK